MMLTLIAFTLLFMLALLGFVLHIKRCAAARQNSRHYLELITGLRRLFEHIPQHRGMANAYLRGDESFKEKLNQTQRQIDGEIEALDGLFSEESGGLLLERWQGVKSEWQQLKSQLGTLAAPQSFHAHTHLVQEVIYLIGDAAQRSNVCQALAEVRSLSNIVFDELPMMMEFVGRARGIGTGAANSQKLSVANRVELSFYASRVEEAVANTSRVLGGLMGQPALASLKGLAEESRQLTLDFIDQLKHDLLGAEKIVIKPSDYYEAGTAAIGKNLMLFDSLMPLIADSTQGVQSKQRANILVAGIAMVFLAMVLAWRWIS